jgi:hypothetical protein
MELFIPTRGRAARQETYKRLAQAGIQAKLVVPEAEASDYNDYPIVATPAGVQGIGPTRQWIIDNAEGDHVCMIDDDLSFFYRKQENPALLRDITDFELRAMFSDIDHFLFAHPLVGIASREGANRNTSEWVFNTRILRLLAYDVKVLRYEGIRFDTIPLMEDFHVALSLLERGHMNLVMNMFAQNNDKGSNSPGGCSTYRTSALQAEAARKLAELHPQFVTVVRKEGWKDMEERLDVRIQWKQAYEYGKRRRANEDFDARR